MSRSSNSHYTPTSNFYGILANIRQEPMPKEMNSSDDIVIPTSNVHRTETGFTITEDLDFKDSEVSISSYGRVDTHTYSDRQISHLPHDMVLSYFTSLREKDLKMGAFFGIVGESTLDNPSPDFLFTFDDRNFLMEVGTNVMSSRLESLYKKKYSTYQAILEERGNEAFILVITVSPNSIFTNIPITQRQADLIIARYRYGLSIQGRAFSLGWRADIDSDELERTHKIEESMRALEWYEGKDKLHINKETIDNWSTINEISYLKGWMNDAREIAKTRILPKESQVPLTIKDFYSKVQGTRTKMKKVVNFPLFRLFDPVDDRPFVFRSGSAHAALWTEAFQSKLDYEDQSYEDYSKLVLNHSEELEERVRKETRDEMKKKNRVKVALTEKEKTELAKFGINGKKYKNSHEVKHEATESREPFSMDVPTHDIQDFVDSWDYLMEQVDDEDFLTYRFSDFMAYAEEMSYKSEPFVTTLLKTRLFQGLITISSLFSEINLNIRKPCQSNEWILTKSRSTGLWILLKTTGSNKHIFYSILTKIEKTEIIGKHPLFNNFIDLNDGWVCSQISSLTVHDLSQWLSIYTKAMSILAVLADVWHFDLLTNPLELFPCKKEFLSSLLILMENKEHTSSSLQNIRYMYMEMVKPKEVFCDPFKVMTKFPVLIRSRLLVWFIKNIDKAFSRMLTSRPQISRGVETSEDDDDQLSRDVIPGLLSVCSLEELPYFECALNLSYLGTFHNPDKGEEIHGYLKIFSKVIKEELNMREDKFRYKYSGTFEPIKTDWSVSPSEFRSHEFNLEHCLMIGKVLKKHFLSKGLSIEKVREAIIDKLKSVNFVDLATFKASANDDEFSYDDDLDYDNYIQPKRNKALAEVLKMLKDLDEDISCPFLRINKLMTMLIERGGIVANLFKKQQLTGVREIFVLTMLSRIVVHFLEKVSRTLCELCDNEYLTKGIEKTGSTIAHYRKVRQKKRTDEETITVSDSADATTWAQKFIMPVFSSVYSQLLDSDDPLLKVLNSVFNLMTDKRLELPMSLLALFRKNPRVRSREDSYINELKEQFLGISDHSDLLGKNSVLMHNRSNFMQGILHYTSSLVHSGHMMLITEVIDSMAKSNLPMDCKVVTSTKVSSDDSSRMTTVIYDPNTVTAKEQMLIKIFLLNTSAVLEASYPLFGAKLSYEKSTLMVMCGVEEFNSMWTVVNTVMTPKIKWAFSSQMLKISTSSTERQTIDHNLINDLVSNGCRRTTAQIAEIGCMLNHYDSIGMWTTNRMVWNRVVEGLIELKSPMVWFYLLSHHIIGTSLGFQLTRYVNCVEFEECRRSEFLSRRNICADNISGITFDYHTTIPIGFGFNYKKFLSENGIMSNEDIEQRLQGQEDLLFRQAENREECVMKIHLKARNQSVAKAFSFSSSSKQHSLAAYMISKPSITLRTGTNTYKMSLPAIIENYKVSLSDEVELSKDIFPQKLLYDRLLNELEKRSTLPSYQRLRKYLLKIRVPKMNSVAQVPLTKVVMKKWFGMAVRYPKYLVDLSYNRYKAELSWLRESFGESYEEFKNTVGISEIVNFAEYIKRFDPSTTTVVFMHSGKILNGIESNLISSFSRNYQIGQILINPMGERLNLVLDRPELVNNLEMIENNLSILKTLPPTKRYDSMILDNCKVDEIFGRTILSDLTLSEVPIRYHSLLTISKYHDGRRDVVLRDNTKKAEFIEALQRMGSGLLSYYEQSQKKTDEGWKGFGVLKVLANGSLNRIEITDNRIRRFQSTNPEKLLTAKTQVVKLLKDLKLHTEDFYSSIIPSQYALILNENVGLISRNIKGLPIIKEPSILFECEEKDITLRMKLNKARNPTLSFRIGDLEGDTVTFRPSRTSLGININLPDGLTKSWCTQREASSRDMRELYELAEESEAVFDWAARTLKCRLSELNKMPRSIIHRDIINEETIAPPPRESMYDQAMRALNMDLGSVIENFKEGFEIDVGFDQEIESWGDYAVEMDEKMANSKNWVEANMSEMVDDIAIFDLLDTYDRFTSFDYTNRFWDPFIRRIESKLNVKLDQVRTMKMDMTGVKQLTRRLMEEMGFEHQIETISEEDEFDI